MAENDRQVGPDEFSSPFLFVPTGEPDPAAWKAAHPGWVSFPATLAPGAAPPESQGNAGADRANWPKDRWGHRYRPLDEYGPGERAPGERSPGFPEPDSAGFGAVTAAMDDPVGTLRGLGYNLTAAPRPPASGTGVTDVRYIPDERPRQPYPNAFRTLSQAGKDFLYAREVEPGSEHTGWPGGGSGVTLGPGYDMRYRTPREVVDDLVAVGVDAKAAAKVSAGAGLRGKAAQSFAKQQIGTVTLTTAQQHALMLRALPEAEQAVRDVVQVPLNDNEFAVLTSLAYNVGAPRFRTSNLVRKLNDGDRAGAISELLNWDNPKVQMHRGLSQRRVAEVRLFESPSPSTDSLTP